MGPSERLRDYCREVSGYIRWKRIRPEVEAEIEDHLQDQRDAYMAAGDDEETAAGRAIAQMGDPALVGRALDRTHRPRPQWFLAGLTGLLMLLGLAVNCFVLRPAPGLLVVAYFLPYALAFGVFLCFYFMDFSQLGRHGWTLYGLVLAFAALGILLGEWGPGSLLLTVGRLRIRLSYLALVFPAVYALAVYRMRSMGLPGILLSGAACLPPAVVLLLVSNLSGLILYAVAALGTLCLAIGRGWFGPNRRRQVLLISALLAGALLCLAVLGRRYLSGRLGILLHPEQDRLGAGYVYCMIRDILSESVWWGTGGVPEWVGSVELLPNLRTDFALVYLAHRFGFAAWLGMAALMAVFSAVGVRKALEERSMLGALLALAAALTLAVQAGSYLICSLGYGLFGPLSLPFISDGLGALLLNAALTGLMLSVFRTGEAYRDRPLPNGEVCGRRSAWEPPCI